MIATEGQRGHDSIRRQKIRELKAEQLCANTGASGSACMSVLGEQGEHVREVFRYSEAVSFLKGDGGGKSWRPFQNKAHDIGLRPFNG